MLARLLPLLLAVVGLAAGAGAGFFLRPAAPEAGHDAAAGDHGEAAAEGHAADDHAADGAAAMKPEDGHAAEDGHGAGAGDSHAADAPADDTHAGDAHSDEAPVHDYVKLNNQFVVPVVEEGQVAALVILSLSLEVTAGLTETVYQIEPKLRDSFLQVMFDHANSGGFKGTFTDGSNMVLLRQALLEIAQRIMGSDISDVLIVDIVRQDS